MLRNERILFERVLFATNLSPESIDALYYAVALARSYGSKLLLCPCISSRPANSEIDDTERRLGELLAGHMSTDVDTPLKWEGIKAEGDMATEVVRIAAEHRIDLIVLYSRRNSGVAAVLDPIAEAISRTAPCPVLIKHQQEQQRAETSREEIVFQRILVAYDFSGDSELALTYGLSLAQEFQSELHLLHVLAPAPTSVTTEGVRTLSNPENAFHATAKRLRNVVPAEAHLWSEVKQVVSQGLPYREILSYARENEIDLICIGASGAGFGQWALFGSNTDRILRQAPCPVFIARPLKPVANKESFAVNCKAAI
jgi:nucleotide-binding universal stress UspA family protein